jgi:DNA-binding NarL/FixJ family response regulator
MPIKRRTLPAVAIQRDVLLEIKEQFRAAGFDRWSIKSTDAVMTFTGQAATGDTIRSSLVFSDGFQEQTISRTDGVLTTAKRRAAARKLRKLGLTQAQIADRLGCSQRTISNDLR